MRHVLIPIVILLAGCDAAGPGFRGVEPTTREVEGSRFTIRVRDAVAEVIRTSPEFPARFGPISERAQKAVFLETGCEPEWVTGDPSIMRMGLSCNGAPAPQQPRQRMISCEIHDAYISDYGGGSAALECVEF